MSAKSRFLTTLMHWLNGLRRDRDPWALAVAFEIGRQIDPNLWEAWPSVRSIAKNLRVSEPTVRAVIVRLETRGHLAVERRPEREDRYRMIIKRRRAETTCIPVAHL